MTDRKPDPPSSEDPPTNDDDAADAASPSEDSAEESEINNSSSSNNKMDPPSHEEGEPNHQRQSEDPSPSNEEEPEQPLVEQQRRQHQSTEKEISNGDSGDDQDNDEKSKEGPFKAKTSGETVAAAPFADQSTGSLPGNVEEPSSITNSKEEAEKGDDDDDKEPAEEKPNNTNVPDAEEDDLPDAELTVQTDEAKDTKNERDAAATTNEEETNEDTDDKGDAEEENHLQEAKEDDSMEVDSPQPSKEKPTTVITIDDDDNNDLSPVQKQENTDDTMDVDKDETTSPADVGATDQDKDKDKDTRDKEDVVAQEDDGQGECTIHPEPLKDNAPSDRTNEASGETDSGTENEEENSPRTGKSNEVLAKDANNLESKPVAEACKATDEAAAKEGDTNEARTPEKVTPDASSSPMDMDQSEADILSPGPKPETTEAMVLDVQDKKANQDEANEPLAYSTKQTLPRQPVQVPSWEIEDETDRFDFPEFVSQPRQKKRKAAVSMSGKRPNKTLKINIRSFAIARFKTGMETNGPNNAVTPPFEALLGELMVQSSNEASLGKVSEDAWREDAATRKLMEQELEDSLLFFQETHEDQDPEYIVYAQKREEMALKQMLAQLDAEDSAGRKEIDDMIAQQSKDKQTLTNRNIEKYKAKATAEEQRDFQKLLQLYNDKVTANQSRINQGFKILTRRHEQEMEQAGQQHRNNFPPQHQQSPHAQQQWAAIAQQLQNKHQRQMQEFNAKGEEMKKKSEADYKREEEKLRVSHQKRQNDIESSRRKVYAKIYNGFQQLRQRYVKRHAQKIAKKREVIILTCTPKHLQKKVTAETRPVASVSEKKEDNAQSREPIESFPDWLNDELLSIQGYELSGAATRHNRRKGILSHINKQLSIEIHNEGVWVIVLSDKGKDGEGGAEDSSSRSNATKTNAHGATTPGASGTDDKPDSGSNDEKFFPWGVKAYSILFSVMCGEIPEGYFDGDKNDNGEIWSLQCGQIRCLVTDLRTSENTASSQRASSLREQEESHVAALERKVVELAALASEAAATLCRAEGEEKECVGVLESTAQEVEKARKIQDEFREKFSPYLGPDGNPLHTANPNDRQELSNAIMRYKSNLDMAESKNKEAMGRLSDARARTQKMQALAKHAQKAVALATGLLKKKKTEASSKSKGKTAKLSESAENEKAATRVKEVVSSFQKAAEKRRMQLNQKRSSSASTTWVQSLPGLAGPLKKALWHKMHRKRQQIVLRPSLLALVSGLRDTVTSAIAKAGAESIEDEVLRAEGLLCLAMHPVSPEVPLPSAPLSNSASEAWAEPGWQLRLDVPKDDSSSSRILPCAPSFPVFTKNLAEMSSAPGRQAASLCRKTHLRGLASNLSAAETATSLAEHDPSVTAEVTLVEGDPLNVTEELLTAGYMFQVPPPPKPALQRRRSSSATKEAADAAAEAKRLSAAEAASIVSATSQASQSSANTADKKKQADKRRRSSKSTPEPSPRTQRRKSEAKSRSSASVQQQTVVPSPSAGVVYNSSQQMPQPMGQPAMAQQAAPPPQYNQYMNAPSPGTSQHQQAPPTFQLLQQQRQAQQQQQQPQYASPQQPQQPQYASPQQHQMAHMRMMQQQQQVPPGYPQQPGAPQGMQHQYFNPMTPAPGVRQQSFGQPQHMQGGMPGSMQGMSHQMGQPNVMQRQPSLGGGPPQNRPDDSNDPLFMLK